MRNAYLGFSLTPTIRRRAASGGVITQTLVYLLEQGLVQGAVVVRQGPPKPWLAMPVIPRTPEEVIAASQSIYAPVPVNLLLEEMAAFPGRLAYVGLPDQVAALRRLQQLGHPAAGKVDYVLGPYVGTNLYGTAIAATSAPTACAASRRSQNCATVKASGRAIYKSKLHNGPHPAHGEVLLQLS